MKCAGIMMLAIEASMLGIAAVYNYGSLGTSSLQLMLPLLFEIGSCLPQVSSNMLHMDSTHISKNYSR